MPQDQQHPHPALEDVHRVVVVSTHPDDFARVGDLVTRAHRSGIQVYVVLLTAGESSPHGQLSRHAVATRRLAELDTAVDLMAPGSPVVFLGAPDGGVADVEDEVVAALGEIVGDGQGTLLVAPMGTTHQGRSDHRAAERATARVAAACSARLVGPTVVPPPREGGSVAIEAQSA